MRVGGKPSRGSLNGAAKIPPKKSEIPVGQHTCDWVSRETWAEGYFAHLPVWINALSWRSLELLDWNLLSENTLSWNSRF